MDLAGGPSEAVCGTCGAPHALRNEAIVAGELVRCAWCDTADLYVQKDFPHQLGLTIVVVGFAISTVFWYYYMPLSAFAVLLTTAALDLVLYYLVPEVTICYRCLGQFRGPGANVAERFQPFDLAIGERYRQERMRVAELRRQGRSAASPPPGE